MTKTLVSDWSIDQRGPYIYVVSGELNIISVFDELRYDRSDVDMLSPAMRMHLVKKLKTIGFKQRSGTVVEQQGSGVKCLMPKAHALGASPFHITDACPKRDTDYYALTPTQTACQFIRHCDLEQAIEEIKRLMAFQPINIYRLSDYLEYEPDYQYFRSAIGHIKYLQRVALESQRLARIKPLSASRI